MNYYAESDEDEDNDDDDEEDDDYSTPRGLTGLQNLGNTCYMNAALQALSNCPPLTRFMLDCATLIRKPGIAKSYGRLMREMWDQRRPSYVVPLGIANGIKTVCPLFRGYTQQDAQEFLRCFLDQLHEELKEAQSYHNSLLVHNLSEYLNSSANSPMISDYGTNNDTDSNTVVRIETSSEADDTNSDTEYETCDSGLSSVKSAFENEDNMGNIMDDEMNESTLSIDINLPTMCASTPSAPPPSCSPTNTTNHFTGQTRSPSPSPTCGQQSHSPRHQKQKSPDRRKPISFRSIISDIFDGRILSSVQCLKCDNVSQTRETFQDLSLPIPSREQLLMLRAQQQQKQQSCAKNSDNVSGITPTVATVALTMSSLTNIGSNGSLVEFAKSNVTGIYTWLWDWIDWMIVWFLGPTVTLQDCLSAFFSADELKGDNMYSCEKCNKLRNGVKFSKVLQLPEILSIHLKRFRHELMYSSKIASHVAFPLEGLDMSPYMASDSPENCVTTYDLVAVICHHGTAASGHYTAYALNQHNDLWYEFDDQYVTSVDCQQVANCDAYVLFYRKSNDEIYKRRVRAVDLMKLSRSEPSLPQFYVSKEWVNRFNTFAEPGPITNYDFLCDHGNVDHSKLAIVHELCIVFSHSVWEYLHSTFGGGPVCTKLSICHICPLPAPNS